MFIDLHGLAGNKECSVDICINNGVNSIHTPYPYILEELINTNLALPAAIDKYYKAERPEVLSRWVNETFKIPAIELEINGSYRWLEDECLNNTLLLISILKTWITQCSTQ